MNARPLRLSTAQADFESLFQQRLHWSADTDAAIEQRVADILADVKARGDTAVLDYTARFDGLQAASMADLELQQSDFKAAFDSLPEAQKRALQDAADRIRSYHEAQKKACGESWQYRDADGSLLGQKVTPLDRAGIYVPGGKAAYPSSLLMNAIPAHVAGVGEIIMVVPTPVRGSVATGGVLQANGDFTRLVGTDPSKVQWTGSGGFAAVGGALNVSLNNGFGQAAATQTWAAGSFVPAGSSLLFGSASATDNVNFKNNINLNGGNRSILVMANAAMAATDTTLSLIHI